MYVSFFTVFIFLAVIQVLRCVFLLLHVFHCSLPYPSFYSVCFSFGTFFGVSRHMAGHTVFVSHFPIFFFFSFLTIAHVPQCVFLIFHVFLLFLATLQVLHCVFLIFHDLQFSRHNPGSTVFISHCPRF